MVVDGKVKGSAVYQERKRGRNRCSEGNTERIDGVGGWVGGSRCLEERGREREEGLEGKDGKIVEEYKREGRANKGR